jgi:hypothetical protein
MEPMSRFHPSLPADYRWQYFGNGLLAFFVFKSKFTFGFKTHRAMAPFFSLALFSKTSLRRLTSWLGFSVELPNKV